MFVEPLRVARIIHKKKHINSFFVCLIFENHDFNGFGEFLEFGGVFFGILTGLGISRIRRRFFRDFNGFGDFSNSEAFFSGIFRNSKLKVVFCFFGNSIFFENNLKAICLGKRICFFSGTLQNARIVSQEIVSVLNFERFSGKSRFFWKITILTIFGVSRKRIFFFLKKCVFSKTEVFFSRSFFIFL